MSKGILARATFRKFSPFLFLHQAGNVTRPWQVLCDADSQEPKILCQVHLSIFAYKY